MWPMDGPLVGLWQTREYVDRALASIQSVTKKEALTAQPNFRRYVAKTTKRRV